MLSLDKQVQELIHNGGFEHAKAVGDFQLHED
jgi:hypothetical protein